ncbi:GbsR/MarR family transcriptional regulator [Polluticoccus soli]|uniref:GbsR/MarR family transcriptional regulator n=1 Tax=Polluticoccus soli TaxID=3034150 RepID=UPI0023E0BF3D|nr:hypothetical protein [Flavipsychrobacter sp. JY13-12]
MSTMKLSQEKLSLIEEFGVFHEQNGMQPAAGRVIALLFISDNVELTFEEIYETLHMSKSAASNAINFLLSTNRIEYITKPGERRRYFRVKAQNITDVIQRSLTGMNGFNTMLKKVLEHRPAHTKDFNNRLKEVTQFMDFLHAELPVLFQKWEQRKK